MSAPAASPDRAARRQMRRRMRNNELRLDFAVGFILLAIFILLPLLTPGKYVLGQITLFFIWGGTVVNWNLIFGVAGIYSLAQMAVFLVGGYTVALMGFYWDVSLWAGAILGALFAGIFSVIVGAATLRLRGPYVLLLTLAIAVVVQKLVQSDVECFFYQDKLCYPLTGGARGLMRFGNFGFREWLGFKEAPLGTYYLGLVLIVVSTVFAFAIIKSPFGSAFRALRDNQPLAASRGINRVKYQILVFGLSGFFTGLMGVLYAGHFRVIGTNMLDFELLFFLFTMLAVGGLGSRWGPIIGGIAIMLANEVMKEFGEWRMVAFGGITVVFVVAFRQGLVGMANDLWLRWSKPMADKKLPASHRSEAD